MEKNEAEASILGEYSKEVIKTKYISYCPVCLYEHAWDTKKEQEEMLKNWREYGLGAKVSQLRAERDEAAQLLDEIKDWYFIGVSALFGNGELTTERYAELSRIDDRIQEFLERIEADE